MFTILFSSTSIDNVTIQYAEILYHTTRISCLVTVEEKKWTKLESPPSPRCAHSSVLTRNRYIDVYGGWDGAGIIFNDFISYDIEMNSWSCSTNCSTSNSTSMGGKEKSCSSVGARFAHCACPLWGDTFILAGGVNASSDLSDIVTIQRA